MKRKYYIVLALAISLIVTGIKTVSKWKSEASQEQATSWHEVVEYARKNLPLEGKLVTKSDGFSYLKVDNEYIHTLFPMLGLADKGFHEPPFFRTHRSPGAHITVFKADEHVFPDETGQIFHFELKDIRIIQTSNGSYAILRVEAPELEKLREKYGIKSKLYGHKYHITLAKKRI